MSKPIKVLFVAIVLLLLSTVFYTCTQKSHKNNDMFYFTSYRDIPGVTQEEIKAIEALREEIKKQERSLIVCNPHNTESFYTFDGRIDGFIAILCEWLTDFFDIPFTPEIRELNQMLTGVLNKDIDFGTNSYTPERQKTFIMTEPIYYRSLKMLRIRGSRTIYDIERRRKVRYAFLRNATQYDLVKTLVPPDSFEPVFAMTFDELYQLISKGEADAIILYNSSEAAFDAYPDIVVQSFLPIATMPGTLSTTIEEYAPIISVLTKALKHGASQHFTELYRQGYQAYKKNKLFMQLTDEEKEYIQKHQVIPFVTQYSSYPVSFYNKTENKWQGIVFDVLKEIEQLTGLSFNLINDNNAELPVLLRLLADGKAYCMPNMVHSPERKEKFLLSNIIYLPDQYALLSKTNYPNVELNDIPFERVAVFNSSAYTEKYNILFPEAQNTIKYPNSATAYAAVDRGEVNLVMSSKSRLYSITNYHELSDFKVNYLFDSYFEASFGFNPKHYTLLSIIDKTLSLINTNNIVEQWNSKTYNIDALRLRSQRPWLIIVIVLILIGFVIVTILLAINVKRKRMLSVQATELSDLLAKTKQISDYELMKHALAINALNFALWDYDITDEERESKEHFSLESKFRWSQEFRQMLGFKNKRDFPDTLQSWANQVHPDDYDRVTRAITAHLNDKSGRTPYNLEYRMKTKSGEYRYFHEVGMTKRDKYGNPLHFAGGFEDINERVTAKQELQKREKMLNVINKVAIVFLSSSDKNFDDMMGAGVKLIGDALDLDEVSIFQTTEKPEGFYFTQVYNWNKQTGGTTAIREEFSQETYFNGLTPNWESALSSGTPINGPRSIMKKEEYNVMEHYGIMSLYGVPVFIDYKHWGFVLFEDQRNERYFDDISTDIMRSAAFLFVTTIINIQSKKNKLFITDQLN